MNWIIVKKFPLDTDLSLVNGFLYQRGIVHQIYEEAGEQVIAVKDPAMVEPLLQLLEGVMKGSIHIEQYRQPNGLQPAMPSFIEQIKAAALTSLFILLSFAGALLIYLDPDYQYAHLFTFQNLTQQYFIPFNVSLSAGEFWRLVTPAFLHFGFLHVLFNSMWMWDLGRRLELLLGKKYYLLFFIVTASVSNVAQYMWKHDSIFGGMSGVVYALVGFIMVSHKLVPHKLTAVPKSMLGFMLFWLVLCMTGVVDFLAGGGVANAAHLGGLLAGAAYACFTDKYIKAKFNV